MNTALLIRLLPLFSVFYVNKPHKQRLLPAKPQRVKGPAAPRFNSANYHNDKRDDER